jgi:hypothetical protein
MEIAKFYYVHLKALNLYDALDASSGFDLLRGHACFLEVRSDLEFIRVLLLFECRDRSLYLPLDL